MRGLLFFLGWICLGPCTAVGAQDPTASPDAELQTLLESLVDAAPGDRRAKADALAARDVSLERWLAAAAAFGRFQPAQVGLSRVAAVLDGGARTNVTLFVPSTYDPKKPSPLLMAYHGAGGDGRWLAAAWKALAEKHGLLLVAPHEPLSDRGYTGTPRERANAWAALRWARRRFNVDEDRVLAVGYSRGAHLVWDLALRRPDRFAAIGAVVGGPRIALANSQNNLRLIENVVHVPILSIQGAKDDPRLLHNVRMTFKRLKKLEAPSATSVLQADKGHDADWTREDWGAWIAASRQADPKRVVRAAVHGGATRAAWVQALDVSEKAAAQFVMRVPASKAAGLTDEKMRELFQKEADKRTARLQAKRFGPGRFHLTARMVGGARLLLTEAAQGDKTTMQISWRGRAIRKPVEKSRRVLLREFAERFDRRFLPTVEVQVP